jgi:hypothetical protein
LGLCGILMNVLGVDNHSFKDGISNVNGIWTRLFSLM